MSMSAHCAPSACDGKLSWLPYGKATSKKFQLFYYEPWKRIFAETTKFSSKHLVGKGIFATFAGELHNSITNQIKIVARMNKMTKETVKHRAVQWWSKELNLRIDRRIVPCRFVRFWDFVSKNDCASAKYESELSLCFRLARSLTYCYNSRGLW